MFRYVFRRLLWVIPSALGVSLLTFFLLSYLPEPAARPGVEADRLRERLHQLPLFFNLAPEDVRSRTAAAVSGIVDDPEGAGAKAGARELLRLGGAALAVIVPTLDALGPEDRTRVALSLVPLAERMGLPDLDRAADPNQAVLYWNRFWQARGVEFREPIARSAVRRFVRFGTEAREDQLRLLDTYALPYLLEELDLVGVDGDPVELTRITSVLAALTGRAEVVRPGDSPRETSAKLYRYQRWWLVYRHDYQRLAGADRVSGFLLQSRYGHWIFEATILQMGKDEQGRPVLGELLRRGKLTATLLLLGLALAYLLAIPLGALAAFHRGGGLDVTLTALVLVPYALSPAVVATLVLRYAAPLEAPMVWAVGLVALALSADPTRHQRTAVAAALASDFAQAARARGASPLRLLLRHGVKNALLPVLTRLSTELPLALTACFVVERALGLSGLGEATLEAVAAHDTRWLMALALLGSVLAVLALASSDLANALVDPRLRSAVTMRRRRM
ncbi:MAG: ABC transporter permease [Myxococcales bacterium]|nr:ABC transporter permease [Myxococcales bacterium]